MKNLAMIACISRDGGLGQHNDLLWHIPADMKFFRQTTKGHPIIMGGKTFKSIGKVLPDRENVVLSRSRPEDKNVVWVKNMTELNAYIEKDDSLKFIIGGASLYEQFLDEAEVIYLTEVNATKPAEVYFPKFQQGDFSIEILDHGIFEDTTYEIKKYQRKSLA